MGGIAPASSGPATGSQFDNRRVFAALIDLALLVPVALLMSVLFGGFTGAAAALTMGWALYYYFALESDHGQTIGKRVMKIRVARADGSPLDAGRVAVRTLLRPIDGIGAYLVGLVVMLATGQRRQRLGDLAAGTVVTEAGAPVAPVVPEPTESHAAPEAPVIEPPPEPEPEVLPDKPEADTGLSADQIPQLRPFDPFSEPEREPEAEAHEVVPVERADEPEPDEPTDHPVPVPEPEAEEPPVEEAEEPPVEETEEPSRLEIISSPIDLVMEGHDEPEGPEEPPRAS